MQRLRREYNDKIGQVVGSLLLVFCLMSFVYGCKSSVQLIVTSEREAKDGERDGAQIDSLSVNVVKEGKADYTVEYRIKGQITEEYWGRSLMLKKIRVIEESNSSDSVLYDKRITLIPVQVSFFGKAGMYPQPFYIKNEYKIKNDLRNPTKKVLFVSGDKEFLLELK